MDRRILVVLIVIVLVISLSSIYYFNSQSGRKCVSGCNPTSDCRWIDRGQAYACPKVLQVGNVCTQYAECKVVNGKCKKVTEPEYEGCLNCLEECGIDPSGSRFNNCTSNCEDKFERDEAK